MGCGASNNEVSPSTSTLQEVKKRYKIPNDIWAKLNREFNNLSHNTKKVQGKEFVEHFSSFGLGEHIAKQIARALDRDDSDEISDFEYLSFFCLHMGGTEQEKISSLFIILDADGSGLVSKSELTEFFATGIAIGNPSMNPEKVKEEATAIAKSIVKGVDLSGDGQLSIEEVMQAAKNDPKYRNLFLAFSQGMSNNVHGR